ncbi:hypothetical protein BCR42DRAFT_399283 [Absidia repens]|uniref:Uncharacterized protein n=1 Tax=Absidia repens TaxID=90262 RepID=A0A1X2J1F0_9FUNG|nr:hypothetical protein BCR42DRAFT_399283 [Absidia repens]
MICLSLSVLFPKYIRIKVVLVPSMHYILTITYIKFQYKNKMKYRMYKEYLAGFVSKKKCANCLFPFYETFPE